MRQSAPLFVERPALEPTGPLSKDERRALAEAERAIRAASGSFHAQAKALAAIRDRRLYRAEYQDFDGYCTQAWDLSRSRVCQLIGAAQIVDHLRTLTIVNILPTCEGQVRPLLKLSHKEGRKRVLDLQAIVQAWQEVLRCAPVAPDGSPRITASLVKEVADRFAADELEQTRSFKRRLAKLERHLRNVYKPLVAEDRRMYAQVLHKVAGEAEGG